MLDFVPILSYELWTRFTMDAEPSVDFEVRYKQTRLQMLSVVFWTVLGIFLALSVYLLFAGTQPYSPVLVLLFLLVIGMRVGFRYFLWNQSRQINRLFQERKDEILLVIRNAFSIPHQDSPLRLIVRWCVIGLFSIIFVRAFVIVCANLLSEHRASVENLEILWISSFIYVIVLDNIAWSKKVSEEYPLIITGDGIFNLWQWDDISDFYWKDAKFGKTLFLKVFPKKQKKGIPQLTRIDLPSINEDEAEQLDHHLRQFIKNLRAT